jgi:hypothetical protein
MQRVTAFCDVRWFALSEPVSLWLGRVEKRNRHDDTYDADHAIKINATQLLHRLRFTAATATRLCMDNRVLNGLGDDRRIRRVFPVTTFPNEFPPPIGDPITTWCIGSRLARKINHARRPASQLIAKQLEKTYFLH